jgi:cell division transport system permease protein
MASTTDKKTKRHGVKVSPFAAWWNHTNNAMAFSLKRMWYNPVSTWITLAAIAIALSLPTGLHLLLKNMQTLTDDKRELPSISLFMKQDITEQQARDRAELLSGMTEIESVLVVTRDDALEEFRQITGFAETLETLDENPLPHVLVVTPRLNLLGDMDKEMERLSRKLKNFNDIEVVQMDIEWVQRLRAIIRIAERIVIVVFVLLALTVLLVVGNTIRLDIENRKEEIDVTRFIGATRSYIRRPFLYGGLWYGLFGGIISLVIVHISLLFLISPINQLAKLYASHFTLNGLDIIMTLKILLLSCILGLVGAWLAVGRHLRKSEVIV